MGQAPSAPKHFFAWYNPASVNVSTRDLQDPGFCQRVQQLLQQHGIQPKQLRLEIVESGLMQDAHSSIALLHRLRDVGVQLSIDDFGTGYSSLAYLQQLPVSELKIDRSFIDRHRHPADEPETGQDHDRHGPRHGFAGDC